MPDTSSIRRARRIDPRDAAAANDRGELLLVDVRERDERAEEHISGSCHIPLGELGDRMGELRAGKPVAFLCRSGGRSAIAAAAAEQMLTNVADVRGGMVAWAAAGLPTTTTSTPAN